MMRDETPDVPQQRSEPMPMLKFEPEGISPDQEKRATALTLAVEHAKHWTKPGLPDVFAMADRMFDYIDTGHYETE